MEVLNKGRRWAGRLEDEGKEARALSGARCLILEQSRVRQAQREWARGLSLRRGVLGSFRFPNVLDALRAYQLECSLECLPVAPFVNAGF